MSSHQELNNPEPVPPASQLAVLPFLAAVSGFLTRNDPSMRVTLHRTVNRENKEYLQQVCDYVSNDEAMRRGAGRFLPVNFGIIGASFGSTSVWRTRHFATRDELLTGIQQDMVRNKEPGDAKDGRMSWLSVPFLGCNGHPVLILYADTFEFDYFADDGRVESVVRMCYGFAHLIDALEQRPFPNLRNFPLSGGESVKGLPTVYPSVQEEVSKFSAAKFKQLTSFNYEASLG